MSRSARPVLAFLIAAAWSCGFLLAHHSRCVSTTATLVSPKGRAVRIRRVGTGGTKRALLLHGVTASKETMMFDAEALAGAGYDCLLPDFPGHGSSREAFGGSEDDLLDTIRAATGGDPERFEVVVGHSMGAYALGAAIRRGVLRPRVFVAIGATAQGMEGNVSVLLGAHDELVSEQYARSTGGAAEVFVSPWSDHVLEVFDPHIAARLVGIAAPDASLRTAWAARIAGIAIMGAAFLAALLLFPAGPYSRRAEIFAAAGALALLIATYACAFHPWWLNAIPTPARFAESILLAAALFVPSRIATLAAKGLKRPATFFHGGAIVAAFSVAALLLLLRVEFLGLCAAWGALILTGAAISPAILEWRTRSALIADFVFAGFVGYFFAQWIPVLF